jgi:endonuclease YncB( thermonuclease family)
MRSIRRAVLSLVLLVAATSLQAGSAMAKFASVADGNTVIVTYRGAEMKVRMHGIVVPPADAARPILERLNKETVAFLKKYLADGWIYLEFPDGAPKPEADGVVPAFVYRGSDATFLNKKLVAEGLAIVNRKERNAFTDDLLKVQANASATMRGIWGSFENADGEKIASGIAQSTYIGHSAGGQRGSSSYVTYWIILY